MDENNLKMEKMVCPSCKGTQFEIDEDNHLATCKKCKGQFPFNIDSEGEVLIEAERRRTIQAEHEEYRKDIAFMNEEERKKEEYKGNAEIRKAKAGAKYAIAGIIIGIIISVPMYIIGEPLFIPIIVVICCMIIAIPSLINVKIKLILFAIIAASAIHTGVLYNSNKIQKEAEAEIAAAEEAAKQLELKVNSADLIGQDYKTVVQTFQDNGFINVSSEAVNDITIPEASSQDIVFEVSVKGNIAFKETDVYAENAPIKVFYHNISEADAMIRLFSSSKDLKNDNYETVREQFEDAGFINVSVEPIYDVKIGLMKKDGAVEQVSINGYNTFEEGDAYRYDSPVRIVYHTLESNENKDSHAGSIQIPSSAKKYKGRNYNDVKKELESAGYTNIELVRKTEKEKKESSGDIVLISINGITDFGKKDWFPADAAIIITYYEPLSDEEAAAEHPNQIKIPSSAKKYKGQNYEIVINSLEKAGFTNITSEPVYDIKLGLLSKEGEVSEISVDGVTDFTEGIWFNADCKIRVFYHAKKPENTDE